MRNHRVHLAGGLLHLHPPLFSGLELRSLAHLQNPNPVKGRDSLRKHTTYWRPNTMASHTMSDISTSSGDHWLVQRLLTC